MTQVPIATSVTQSPSLEPPTQTDRDPRLTIYEYIASRNAMRVRQSEEQLASETSQHTSEHCHLVCRMDRALPPSTATWPFERDLIRALPLSHASETRLRALPLCHASETSAARAEHYVRALPPLNTALFSLPRTWPCLRALQPACERDWIRALPPSLARLAPPSTAT